MPCVSEWYTARFLDFTSLSDEEHVQANLNSSHHSIYVYKQLSKQEKGAKPEPH